MRMGGPSVALPGLPSRLAFSRARTELAARMAPTVLVPHQSALTHGPCYAEPRETATDLGRGECRSKAFYCETGVQGAREKGGVEGQISYFRVPIPRWLQ